MSRQKKAAGGLILFGESLEGLPPEEIRTTLHALWVRLANIDTDNFQAEDLTEKGRSDDSDDEEEEEEDKPGRCSVCHGSPPYPGPCKSCGETHEQAKKRRQEAHREFCRQGYQDLVLNASSELELPDPAPCIEEAYLVAWSDGMVVGVGPTAEAAYQQAVRAQVNWMLDPKSWDGAEDHPPEDPAEHLRKQLTHWSLVRVAAPDRDTLRAFVQENSEGCDLRALDLPVCKRAS